MSDEAGSEHEQNHEQFGPGEPTTTHLYLQILETEEEILRKKYNYFHTIYSRYVCK